MGWIATGSTIISGSVLSESRHGNGRLLSHTPDHAIRYGGRATGPPIGSNDLLIAAHACVPRATIVAADTDEFQRIHSPKVEN